MLTLDRAKLSTLVRQFVEERTRMPTADLLTLDALCGLLVDDTETPAAMRIVALFTRGAVRAAITERGTVPAEHP
jgi:hypothetical protein